MISRYHLLLFNIFLIQNSFESQFQSFATIEVILQSCSDLLDWKLNFLFSPKKHFLITVLLLKSIIIDIYGVIYFNNKVSYPMFNYGQSYDIVII